MTRGAKLHIVLTIFWTLMILPTVLVFKDSVLYVAVISIYALIVGHWGAYEAAQAGVHKATLRQVRAVADGLMALMIAYQEDQPDDHLSSEIEELRASLEDDPSKPD